MINKYKKPKQDYPRGTKFDGQVTWGRKGVWTGERGRNRGGEKRSWSKKREGGENGWWEKKKIAALVVGGGERLGGRRESVQNRGGRKPKLKEEKKKDSKRTDIQTKDRWG